MDNSKDKDLQVREDRFAEDLRDALRRKESRRPQAEVPADFLNSVMQRVESDAAQTWRIAASVLVAAACVAFVALMVWPTKDNPKFDASRLVICKERIASPQPSDTLAMSTEKHVVAIPATKVKIKKQAHERHLPPQQPAQMQSPETTDSYMAELENSLADVRDSCYLAQVERMIADNEELQQLMNEMTNHKQ